MALIRGEETAAILQSNIEALKYWISDFQKTTEMTIADKDLVNHIQLLIENNEDAQIRQEVDSLLQPYIELTQPKEYIVTDLNGVIVHSPYQSFIGHRVSNTFGKEIYGAAGGVPQFILPFYPKEGPIERQMEALVWMQIPIKKKDGTVVGTFGIGREADMDFTRILRTARMGKTGETYAINRDGWFISESRYEEEMRKNGIMVTDTNVSSILNLQARYSDPELSSDIRPLTDLAILVVASAESKSTTTRGVLAKPTKDYRGHEVIGAWAWLGEYDFGVITQVDAVEAFAPARYLYIVILVAVGLLLMASAYSFINAFELNKVKEDLYSAADLGQYRLSRIIQAGGMGTVYYAQHKLLKRPTAIKVVRVDKEDEGLPERFEREVKLASQLTHPNTIEIYDYGFTLDNQAYYAMEYLNGVNLAEVVKLSGPLSPARTVHVVRQICGSLMEAHTLGLVHRDIKPQNIMLVNRIGLHDFVKVLDFGLAKPFVQENNTNETRAITGTPVYIAPERLKRPGLAEPSADIYAVGALMYYLLSGHPLFSFSSDLDILYRVLNEDPDPLPDEIPEALARLTMFCLEKDPAERPTSIEEVKLFLDQLATEFSWPAEDAENWWKKFVH